MTVSELVERLKELPPDADVLIAYEGAVRMETEVVNTFNDAEYGRIVVITDEEESKYRENW
jgi:hypothetical protein